LALSEAMPRRPDPYRRGRHDTAQQHARALRLAGEKRLRVEDLLLGRRDGADEYGGQYFLRAPGEAVGTFGLESAMDELAVELRMDPIELRIRNEPDGDPLTGLPFSQRGIVQAWRDGATRFGWDKRSPTPKTRRDGDWLVGLGCATGTYPYYRMPGGAGRLTVTRDGRATVAIAAHQMGMGTATAQAQVAAERLGLPLEQVQVLYGDTLFPALYWWAARSRRPQSARRSSPLIGRW
jgi:xanthine dehydrogenase YagR molybdenum-binding subunit